MKKKIVEHLKMGGEFNAVLQRWNTYLKQNFSEHYITTFIGQFDYTSYDSETQNDVAPIVRIVRFEFKSYLVIKTIFTKKNP